ncbi:MAG: DUF424 domain-containing protein [Nitrosarchaeum sp.]|jgi:hypothetical protein|nr:DUF424 domain-containing protein [Nitrosarchaeum sp.]MBP0119621.1 DUF424 domain-containing protein [Nitrosarchaeum sp.]MBP0134300.1 DUF424 domain-containing protein [Nitrosarchaeum sp.]MDW7641030.1 DUF424 domain-containing protein [Nitrosarchaeum sp.]
MQFSFKVIEYQKNLMLNICDADLVGKVLSQNKLIISISKNYYGDQIIEKDEAEQLLRNSSIINMVGKNIISLCLSLEIGSEKGVKEISDVPFLIVFKT